LTFNDRHELKSPLATIESATDYLIDDAQSGRMDPRQLLAYLNMIKTNTGRLQLFVRDLLTIAKGAPHAEELHKTLFDMRKALNSWVQSHRALADLKKLTITVEKGPACPVTADMEKIDMVVSNLISNAVKFSTHGEITVGLKDKNNSLYVFVQDQGKGLSKNHLGHIFEKFYQVDRGHKGTGIGLSIAKLWVEAHGGAIGAESDGEGKGSLFWFTLPR
jgi:two-component system, OmpR family, sensor histidine kinase BaeS